jgi:tetratricopeptide (TPR) repeat protein
LTLITAVSQDASNRVRRAYNRTPLLEMDSPENTNFLDVHELIERSQPRPRIGWFGYAAGVFLLIVVGSALVIAYVPGAKGVVDLFSKIAMVAIFGALAMMTHFTFRRHRDEMKQVEALEELVQLRRWPEAALLVRRLLAEPARTPQARVQALIFLSSILARYHRFEDAIAVHNHLLETINFDDSTAHGIRLGRAMAMLREDHLVDADRAISELRRTAQGRDSAGLALVELYRDVKTGHPTEAIERFQSALPLFQQQLGHRTGDAYALLAKAYDMRGKSAHARAAYEKASYLTAVSEMNRRYPEVATLAAKFAAVALPAELQTGAPA